MCCGIIIGQAGRQAAGRQAGRRRTTDDGRLTAGSRLAAGWLWRLWGVAFVRGVEEAREQK